MIGRGRLNALTCRVEEAAIRDVGKALLLRRQRVDLASHSAVIMGFCPVLLPSGRVIDALRHSPLPRFLIVEAAPCPSALPSHRWYGSEALHGAR